MSTVIKIIYQLIESVLLFLIKHSDREKRIEVCIFLLFYWQKEIQFFFCVSVRVECVFKKQIVISSHIHKEACTFNLSARLIVAKSKNRI